MTSKKWITCTLLLAAGTLACLLAACHNAYQADTAAGAADSADAPASVSSALQALPPADAPRALRDSMPAGTLPSLDEEVWVITRRVASEMASAERDDIPGSGSMMTETTAADGATSRIPLPLAHTDVAANIEAYIASVTVDQQFHNPFEETIEAVYVFPLPQNAGINGFVMTIGDRRIRGIIRDRAEAEAIYAEARAQGHRASLLTQERPNIFTQKVANLEPGKRIDVEITYFHTLQYDDGWYEYVFPMVVGPRFNPPAFTEGIGAVARGGATTSRQPTNVEYLAPNERSGHDIDLSVAITGLGVQEVVSPTHDINVLSEHSQTTEISLARHDRVPNRDFVLRYRVAGDTVQANLLAHAGERGGHFTLVLHPPAEIRQTHRAPIEMVF
ncbi:MAG: VIT domain-containing protein, partial [Planctomycetota bacterium]